MTKAEWSGWAQVVGTVGAIVAAWGIAFVDAKRRERDNAREQLEQALAYASVVARLICDFDTALSALRAAGNGATNTYNLSEVVPNKLFVTEEQAAAAIPIHQIRDPALVQILIRLQQLIPRARDASVKLVHGWYGTTERSRPDPLGMVSAGAAELRQEAEGINRDARERLHAATR